MKCIECGAAIDTPCPDCLLCYGCAVPCCPTCGTETPCGEVECAYCSGRAKRAAIEREG